MNILIINWRDPKNPKSGGAEIVTLAHAKAWVANGNKVTWFTSEFKKSKREEVIEGINVLRRGNILTVFLYAFIFYLFAGQKFDLVVDEIHGIPFFTPLYVRKPKIAFIHEVAGEIWDYMFLFPINKIGKTAEYFYFKFYKNVKFWTDANSTIEDLVKMGIKKKNCTAISCPTSHVSLSVIPKKEIVPTFIFVSRIVKMKGIEDVLRAFFYILREVPDSQLWIIGDGDKKYIDDLKETIKTYSIDSKVKFFGRVDENKKFELLKKAHILLHASVKEGWGLVVIEAASQATPSVVYNVSGLKDSVKDGKTGVVLKENNCKEMAREAVELFKDKKRYAAFQKNALALAKSLTWKDATEKSLNLIKSL